MGIAAALLIVGLLFVVNGAVLANGESGLQGTVGNALNEQPRQNANEVRVMAFNVAKCFVMTGAVSFESEDVVNDRLDQIVDIVRQHSPDILCLSEIMTEAGPCDVNQVEALAARTGLRHWAFGENYNFGLPILRVVGGNAVLSRFPVESIENPSLAGRQPFYVTKNNRRALLTQVQLPEGAINVWSLHNDSYDMNNNLAQVEQLLKHEQTLGSVMAGDFNAAPGSPPIQSLLSSGEFVGQVNGEPTFPADNPSQRIDLIFGPKNWKVMQGLVIENDVSDHCAVLTVFRRETVVN